MGRMKRNPDRRDGKYLTGGKIDPDLHDRYTKTYYRLREEGHDITRFMFLELIISKGLDALDE